MSPPAHIAVAGKLSESVLRALRRQRALWRFLSSFCCAADASGAAVHLVGGSVRDLVEGRPGKDVDLMVTGVRFDALGRILASLPAKALGIRRIVVAGRRFAVHKVATAWAAEDIDVALARSGRGTGPGRRPRIDGAGARADVSRRDFTINSLVLAFRVRGRAVGGEVIDYFGGLSDLRRGLIRGVGDPRERLREDPLRMLRAIRLKNERPGYAIEPRTWRAIRSETAALAGTIPAERAIPEILRSLSGNPSGTVDDLRRSGLLGALLPEASVAPVARVKRRYALLERALGHPLPETVLLANLLVDVAEAEAATARPRAASAKVLRLPKTEAIARRLHFPGVRRVVQLIEDLHRLAPPGPMPNRNARIEAVFGRWEDPRWLLALYEADRAARSRRAEDFRSLLARSARTPPLISGKDVLATGVPAGPKVEWILERVREATLAGDVTNREDAAALAGTLAEAAASAPQRRRLPSRSARNRPPRRMTRIAGSGPPGEG